MQMQTMIHSNVFTYQVEKHLSLMKHVITKIALSVGGNVNFLEDNLTI